MIPERDTWMLGPRSYLPGGDQEQFCAAFTEELARRRELGWDLDSYVIAHLPSPGSFCAVLMAVFVKREANAALRFEEIPNAWMILPSDPDKPSRVFKFQKQAEHWLRIWRTKDSPSGAIKADPGARLVPLYAKTEDLTL